jgi:geranylgeranyl pyrophosphate synthase
MGSNIMKDLKIPAGSCGTESKTAQVIAAAERFVLEQAVTPRQSGLFVLALNSLQNRIEAEAASTLPLLFLHLPLRVYAALCGDDAPAIPLAIATTLIYLGMDLLDDLADGDLSEEWKAYRPEEITLLSITLLTALPLRLFASLPVSPATRLQMIGLMADAGIRLSAGQGSDLAGAGQENVTVAQVEASVEGKSGSEFALFTALAALLAGATSAQVAHFAEMGRAIGVAGQLLSDWGDLFALPHSRDMASGTRTLPIALYLERVNGTERQTFLDLLDEARHSADAQSAVRTRLETSGIAFQSAFAIEAHCQRARRLFREAALSHPAADDLEAIVSRLSIFDALAISAR